MVSRTLSEQLGAWASDLRLSDVPERVVAVAKTQVLSQLAASRAGMSHPLGVKLLSAFGSVSQPDPTRAACVLSGLGSWLNLDDTAYAGHLSNSTVMVPLAFARAHRLDGERLLAAIIVANECAARVTAAATLGPFRGQTAAHTSLIGAISGRLHCAGAPAETWVAAYGLGLAMPHWTLVHAFLSGDARLLSVLGPVRTAMDACDAALAGLTGATDILEHPRGFLNQFAAVPLPEVVTAGLGVRWHTDTMSFKLRPGGPGIDSAVDCALELHPEVAGWTVPEIEEIVVETSLYTTEVDRLVNRQEPGMPPALLALSPRYTVATALIEGQLTIADFDLPASVDERRWELANKVRLVHDPAMTVDLLASDAPFGDAIRQAGSRAAGWLAEFAGGQAAGLPYPTDGPATTFEHATKNTGACVTVRHVDGRVRSRTRGIPLGAAGSDTREAHWQLVTEKFLATGGAEDVVATCAKLDQLDADKVAELVTTGLAR